LDSSDLGYVYADPLTARRIKHCEFWSGDRTIGEDRKYPETGLRFAIGIAKREAQTAVWAFSEERPQFAFVVYHLKTSGSHNIRYGEALRLRPQNGGLREMAIEQQHGRQHQSTRRTLYTGLE